MTYPAIVVCGWMSEYPIDESMIHCTFENQDCKLTGRFERVEFLGDGGDVLHYCMGFNKMNRLGGSLSESEVQLPLSVQNAGVFGLGLSLSFWCPMK